VPHGAQKAPERSAHGFIIIDDGETQRTCVSHGITGFAPDADDEQRVVASTGRRPDTWQLYVARVGVQWET